MSVSGLLTENASRTKCYSRLSSQHIFMRHIVDILIAIFSNGRIKADARLVTISHDLLGLDETSHQLATPKLKSLEKDGRKGFYPAMYSNETLLVYLIQVIAAGTICYPCDNRLPDSQLERKIQWCSMVWM